MSGDIFNCCSYDARGRVWPVPGRQRPGLPVNIGCTGWPPQGRIVWPHITVVLRQRAPDLVFNPQISMHIQVLLC